MQKLIISTKLVEKLITKHNVRRVEIEECFANKLGPLLIDDRAAHKTEPPTTWFIARTHQNRLLKVVFIVERRAVYLKTAYEPNQDEIRIYQKIALTRYPLDHSERPDDESKEK